MSNPQCEEQVRDRSSNWPRYYQCKRKGVVLENEEWLCAQHSAEGKKKAKNKRDTKYEKEDAERYRDHVLRQACHGLSTEALKGVSLREVIAILRTMQELCRIKYGNLNKEAWSALQAVDALLGMVPDKRTDVRIAVIEALGKIGDKSAVIVI